MSDFSISSFLAVAAAMYFTRGIDWYSQFAAEGAQDQQSAVLTQKDLA